MPPSVWLCTDESREVGGASCGGDTCGVIRAGSLGRCLWPPCMAALSSLDEVPAGVSGGECMAGEEAMDERCAEWAETVREAGLGEGAREGGSETGSKEKFSMRFACMRDFWSVDDRLRSSSSAWGLSGASWLGGLAEAVRWATSWTASEGSISSWTSLKRTDWAGGVDVMMAGAGRRRLRGRRAWGARDDGSNGLRQQRASTPQRGPSDEGEVGSSCACACACAWRLQGMERRHGQPTKESNRAPR